MRFPSLAAVGVLTLVPAMGALSPVVGIGRASNDRPGTVPHGLTLTATPSTGVAPLPVDFDLSIPPNTTLPEVSWSFGDGSFLNGSGTPVLAPVHDYEASGVFVATASATWSSGTVNATIQIQVAAANLSVGIRANVTNGTAPLTVAFTGSSAGGTGTFVSFVWAFGDGDAGTGRSIRYTFTGPGNFPVTLVVTDSHGDTGKATEWVNVSARPDGNSTGPGSGAADPPTSGPNPWDRLLVGGSIWPFLGVVAIAGAALAFVGSRFLSRRESARPEAALATSRSPMVSVGPGSPDSPSPTTGLEPPAALASPPTIPVGSRRLPTRVTQERQIANRLIRHLAELPRMAPGDVPGQGRTQAGLVVALGAGQSAVGRVLGQLERAGVVTVVTTHVVGSPRRVKVYQLTPRGERLGHALRESGPPP